ncbi:monooxygenase [Pseudohyphozyma bogoriensis]|nr:monooxygenase [Pseudohyphozyma bogoriensis]
MAKQRRAIRVAVVGGGISKSFLSSRSQCGIAQGVRLREQLGKNVEITIYERATEPGGVWRDSTWPGAGVDVKIALYQLYSHLNPNWSEVWAGRDEVLAYWNRIIDQHDLRKDFVFDASFIGSTWSTSSQSHTLFFKRASGDKFVAEADVFISAAGALNTPTIPKVPGIESFKGLQWHSSRWQNEVDLRGKRVAVVGTGSSGIQVVPNIAGLVGINITQFIRSPGFFTPKLNRKYTWWEKFVFRYVPFAARLHRWWIFYQYDVATWAKGTGAKANLMRENVANKLLKYLHDTAPKEYHHLLTPHYPLHCKRVAYNAGWLESLHRPNVHLVGDAITAVTPDGLKTSDGTEHPFDVIVWATGFEVSTTGVGLNHGVYGEEGKELREVWEEQQGAEAYLAVSVPKFPNYFIILGPNAISMSWGYTLGNQTEFIARLVRGIYDKNLSSIAPKTSVTNEYNRVLHDRLEKTVLVSSACNAWYKYKGTGKVTAPSGLCGTELTCRTREIKWEDWEGRKVVVPGDKAELVELTTPATWNPFTLIARRIAKGLEAHILEFTT